MASLRRRMFRLGLMNTEPVFALLFSIGVIYCCGASISASSTYLGEPSQPVSTAPAEEKFEIRDVVVTITLPKDNPKLTGVPELDAKIKRSLPRLKCRIEFDIEPKGAEQERLELGITVSAPSRGRHILHSTGPGTAMRTKTGKFVADIELFQSRPLTATDKATMALRVLDYSSGSSKPVEVDTAKGEVIIKQDGDTTEIQ